MQSEENAVSQEAKLLNIETFAKVCSVSEWTIRAACKNGAIASVRIGSRRLIPRTELDRVIQNGLKVSA